MTLYFTGIRVGELTALTPADVDLEKETININKSYQRIKGRDIITPPKTPKSNRVITFGHSLRLPERVYGQVLRPPEIRPFVLVREVLSKT